MTRETEPRFDFPEKYHEWVIDNVSKWIIFDTVYNSWFGKAARKNIQYKDKVKEETSQKITYDLFLTLCSLRFLSAFVLKIFYQNAKPDLICDIIIRYEKIK